MLIPTFYTGLGPQIRLRMGQRSLVARRRNRQLIPRLPPAILPQQPKSREVAGHPEHRQRRLRQVGSKRQKLQRPQGLVYVGAYRHALFTTRYTGNAAAGSTPGQEFRSNDWYFLPWESTVQDDSRIDPNWNWGKAASSPSEMKNQICGKWDKMKRVVK